MTEDLLERQLSDAIRARADEAVPGPGRFDDVAQRADRRRRSRRRVGAATVSSAVLVVVCLVVVAARQPDDRGLTVGPVADEPAATETTAPAVVGDRWVVLSSVEPTRSDPAVTTVSGLQPSVPGSQDVEVAPFVYVGLRSERAVVYGLTGERWTTTVSWTDLPSGGTATTTSITGSGFDPTRFDEIENTSDRYDQIDPSFQPPVVDPSRASARPEDLLAEPGSHEVVLPVEHHGSFDWVVLPERCATVGDWCMTTAVGGDETRLVVVDLTVPPAFDVRSALADVGLRSSDQLAVPPGYVAPYVPPAAWGAAPFFTIRLPIVRDDSVWPAEVPADYCTAYLQWKQIQIDHLGAYGTPGWIRWARAIGALAPPDLADAYAVLADEQEAGRDTSATQPGQTALGRVIDAGIACPG